MDEMSSSTTFTNNNVGNRMVQTMDTERKTRKGLRVRVSRDSHPEAYTKKPGREEGTRSSGASISTTASTHIRAQNIPKRNLGQDFNWV